MTQAEFILSKFKECGFTQEKMAAALGCRQNVISGWKSRGYIPAPQQSRVLKAAEKLGVGLTPSDFFNAPASPHEERAQ